jgi:type II secretory pathway pseudopilin PulG
VIFYREKLRGFSLIEIIVILGFMGAVLMILKDTLLTSQKTSKGYFNREEAFGTILLPIQHLTNDFKYAESVEKITNGYRIVLKKFDSSTGFKFRSVTYTVASDTPAADATLNFKIIRTVNPLDGGATSTSEFPQIAGLQWCVDGIDLVADCPSVGKVATSSARFIASLEYRSGLSLTSRQRRDIVVNLENVPGDGGYPNPSKVQP